MLAVVREIRRHFYLNSNDMTKAEQPKRKAGRPKGSHDKKPRPKMNPDDKEKAGVITKEQSEKRKEELQSYYQSVQEQLDRDREKQERRKFLFEDRKSVV